MSDETITFHTTDSMKFHLDEVVGLDQKGLLVAVKDYSAEFGAKLSPVNTDEVISVKFNKVFSLTSLLIGLLLFVLGFGWVVGFLVGGIAILFLVIALGMILVGAVMVFTSVQTRCEFTTKEGVTLLATGVALKRNAITNWASERGISM